MTRVERSAQPHATLHWRSAMRDFPINSQARSEDTVKPEPILNMEAAILNVEDPTAPDTMGLLLLFNGKLKEAELLERIEKIWLRYPRYRQRVKRLAFGRMQWVEDETFDIRSHVRRVAMPSPNDMATLQRFVGELMAFLLDRSKPLWTMHIIEDGPRGDALLIRVHHAIGDGMMLVKTTLDLFKGDLEEAVPQERKRFGLLDPLSEVVASSQQIGNWLQAQVKQGTPGPLELLSGAEQAIELSVKMAPLVRDPKTSLTGELSRYKEISWTPPVPTLEFKRVSRTFGVSVNDLVLTIITGALRRYFIAQGEPIPNTLHASVPVYLGSTTNIQVGNNFGLVLAPLPIGEPNPLKRVLLVHDAMAKLKKSPEAALVSTAFNTAGLLPPALVARMFNEVSRKASLIVTNVPGPPYTMPLAGAELRHIVPLVPLSGHIGLGIAIASYNRRLSLGIQTDGGRIQPSIVSFIELLRAETALLTALAEEDAAPAATPKPRKCAALTRRGKRCRNLARQGHLTCYVHRAVEEELRETTAKKA